MQNPFHLLSRKEIYRDHFMRLMQDHVRRPSGGESNFSYLVMKSGSTVLPITDDGQVYLIREWKYAVERTCLESMGGGIDEGETPLEAAKRELREEGGLTASEWVSLGKLDPFTSLVNASIHLFLAFGLQHVPPEPGDGEILELVKMPFREAVEKVMQNEITQSGSSAVILMGAEWLRRNRPAAISSWLSAASESQP